MTTTAQGRIGHYRTQGEATLLDCLVRQAGLTREEGEQLVAFGAVYLDRQRVHSDQPLFPGQYIRVHLLPRRFPVEGMDWHAAIVHHEDEFVVANKPAGIPVHATVDNQIENALHQLSRALGTRLYITQRLDADVSGLIVFAKTREFQRQFNQLLVERNVRKRYRALVTSAPERGRHIHYMEPAERSPKTVGIEARSNWLECALSVLDVKPVGPDTFEVEIDLETGRTHQIRAQLSAMGSAIVGDMLYGSQTPYRVNGTPLPGIALFSASTSWSHGRAEWSFALTPPWSALQ